MNFLKNGMQSLGRDKYELIFCILCCIFLVKYSGNFAWAQTRNGCGHFALTNIANTDLPGYSAVMARLAFDIKVPTRYR